MLVSLHSKQQRWLLGVDGDYNQVCVGEKIRNIIRLAELS